MANLCLSFLHFKIINNIFFKIFWTFLINETHQVFAVVTAERDVEEFGLLSQLPEARADVRLEVVPPETN